MQALKEGWDCSFTYVFCSVANIHSAKDVEQILGRVLRMPYAKRRKNEVLNRVEYKAYPYTWWTGDRKVKLDQAIAIWKK